jgi:stearoyl-CoA desaturase (delta-9 desaturase)
MAATTDRRLDAPAEGPGPDDIEPVLHETRDRIITGTVTVVPFFALAFAVWQAWNSLLHWHDVVVFLLLYAATGLGITVGFHRLFTHRSFKTKPAVRAILAVCGSAAIEGPVISWVADHRKHHAFSDQPGDPHSPHVDHGGGWRGALRGLAHSAATASATRPTCSPIRSWPSSTGRSSRGRSAASSPRSASDGSSAAA